MLKIISIISFSMALAASCSQNSIASSNKREGGDLDDLRLIKKTKTEHIVLNATAQQEQKLLYELGPKDSDSLVTHENFIKIAHFFVYGDLESTCREIQGDQLLQRIIAKFTYYGSIYCVDSPRFHAQDLKNPEKMGPANPFLGQVPDILKSIFSDQDKLLQQSLHDQYFAHLYLILFKIVPDNLKSVIEKEAGNDNPVALFNNGYIHEWGFLGKKNMSEALEYYQRADAKEDPASAYRLAFWQQDQLDVYMQKAIKRGYAPAVAYKVELKQPDLDLTLRAVFLGAIGLFHRIEQYWYQAGSPPLSGILDANFHEISKELFYGDGIPTDYSKRASFIKNIFSNKPLEKDPLFLAEPHRQQLMFQKMCEQQQARFIQTPHSTLPLTPGSFSIAQTPPSLPQTPSIAQTPVDDRCGPETPMLGAPAIDNEPSYPVQQLKALQTAANARHSIRSCLTPLSAYKPNTNLERLLSNYTFEINWVVEFSSESAPSVSQHLKRAQTEMIELKHQMKAFNNPGFLLRDFYFPLEEHIYEFLPLSWLEDKSWIEIFKIKGKFYTCVLSENIKAAKDMLKGLEKMKFSLSLLITKGICEANVNSANENAEFYRTLLQKISNCIEISKKIPEAVYGDIDLQTRFRQRILLGRAPELLEKCWAGSSEPESQ